MSRREGDAYEEKSMTELPGPGRFPGSNKKREPGVGKLHSTWLKSCPRYYQERDEARMEKKMKNESLRFWSFVAWAIMALCAITGGIVMLGYLNYVGAICCFAVAAAAFAGAWLMYPEGEVKVETFRIGDGKKAGENLQGKGERDGTDKKKEK